MKKWIWLVLVCLLFGCAEKTPQSGSNAVLICEDKYYKIKIEPSYKGITFWYIEKDNNDVYSYDLDFKDLVKLNAWADNLIRCDGKYEKTRKRWIGNGNYEEHKEWYDCRKIDLKGEMIREYDDGWFCDRCRKVRKAELKKKLDSLK